jgi:hypothetical protein
MNSRDAAVDEKILELIEATKAEAAPATATATAAATAAAAAPSEPDDDARANGRSKRKRTADEDACVGPCLSFDSLNLRALTQWLLLPQSVSP